MKIPIHCSYTELRELSNFVENPRNPNKHPEAQLRLLGKIIATQGWRSPIVVSKRSGFIIKGHGRYQAALMAGMEEAPADLQDYATEADEWADMIADNRIAELAELNQSELAVILKEMDGKIDLDLTGFDINALDRVLGEPTDPIAEWSGMPEFQNEPKACRSLHVHFKTPEDVESFAGAVGQDIGEKTNSIWHPKQERRNMAALHYDSGGAGQ